MHVKGVSESWFSLVMTDRRLCVPQLKGEAQMNLFLELISH